MFKKFFDYIRRAFSVSFDTIPTSTSYDIENVSYLDEVQDEVVAPESITNNSKWNDIVAVLLEGRDATTARFMRQLLENMRRDVVKRYADLDPNTREDYIRIFSKKLLPVVARSLPSVLNNPMYGVSVMLEPVDHVGLIRSNPDGTHGVELVEVDAYQSSYGVQYCLDEAEAFEKVENSIDIEAELLAAIAHDVSVEITQEAYRMIRNAAAPQEQSANRVGGPENRHRVTLISDILNAADNIEKTSGRGKGNVILVPSDVYHIITLASDKIEDTDDMWTTLVTIGNYQFRVVTDAYAPDGTPVIVGYRGSLVTDAGFIWCPHLPVIMKDVENPEEGIRLIKFGYQQGVTYNDVAAYYVSIPYIYDQRDADIAFDEMITADGSEWVVDSVVYDTPKEEKVKKPRTRKTTDKPAAKKTTKKAAEPKVKKTPAKKAETVKKTTKKAPAKKKTPAKK